MTTAKPPERTIAVIQGEYQISSDPAVVLSTILGSCVAVCLFDPVAKIGGMNHFLLPFGRDEGSERPVRYGLFAMEVMINELMKKGALKSRLQAKVFGGARISADFRDIGQSNATFAREFLSAENIQILGESLGGSNARRVTFRPATGLARVLIVPSSERPALMSPVLPSSTPKQQEIDLF